MSKITPGKYRRVAIGGGVQVLREGFDQLENADQAVAEALAGHPDCEIRLTRGFTVLLSAGPARSREP
jgi:hypothetical protein